MSSKTLSVKASFTSDVKPCISSAVESKRPPRPKVSFVILEFAASCSFTTPCTPSVASLESASKFEPILLTNIDPFAAPIPPAAADTAKSSVFLVFTLSILILRPAFTSLPAPMPAEVLPLIVETPIPAPTPAPPEADPAAIVVCMRESDSAETSTSCKAEAFDESPLITVWPFSLS